MMNKTMKNAIKRIKNENTRKIAYSLPIVNKDMKKNDEMVRKFFESMKGWSMRKSYRYSDDRYDYSRDNREGYVDVELRLLEIDRQNRENQKRFEESKKEKEKS